MGRSNGGRPITAAINTKWAATVASIWIQATSGTPSTFGIYSSAVKSSQGYSQSTLDTVALFKDIGANVGILAGLLYATAAYRRGGPKVVIIAGAAQCFAGYFLTWLAVVGVIRQPPVPVMCLFMLLAGHAMPFFNTADVVTAVHNFRDYSGTAVGIMKGFLGLSGAMLIQVYQTIFNGNPSSFLLMVSLLSTISPLFLMWFVKIFETSDPDDTKHLNNFSLVVVLVAVYLVIVIILENVFTVGLFGHVIILVILLLLLASPIFIVIQVHWNKYDEIETGPTRVMQEKEENTRYPLLTSHGDQEIGSSNEAPDPEQNLNLFHAIRTLNFWLLFLATACALGSGLATLNNITQIGESLGYSSLETSTLVSLWSIWNSLGRFGAGYISDYLLHTKACPRPLYMAISLVIMSIGHFVIASGLAGALYAGSVLVGICYGSQLSLMPTITSEIFGVVNMGTIFNTITIAGPIGSYVLSVRVVGYIYDKNASKGSNTCSGVHCFMLSFIIMAGVTLLGSLFAVALYLRTKRLYESVIVWRLQRLGRV